MYIYIYIYIYIYNMFALCSHACVCVYSVSDEHIYNVDTIQDSTLRYTILHISHTPIAYT